MLIYKYRLISNINNLKSFFVFDIIFESIFVKIKQIEL